MLEMIPQSERGWTYDIWLNDELAGVVRFGRFFERGSITFERRLYRVRKHGPLSLRWTLEADRKVVCEAVQTSRFNRRFQLKSPADEFVIQDLSALARGFNILRNDDAVIGSIHPNHPMTRRVTVDQPAGVRDIDLVFAFWLVALTWRRAAEPRPKATVDKS